ncbi:innexin shaking-B-like protein [Sarcoptes scabiei]|uniref:Innexin n=1 Tax=Sarcoptes scabiei TaxID=52283 RepID=A0A132A8J0_SARSC|nr:innexin shaking-B-like protein [Sarcoptes scabiei]
MFDIFRSLKTLLKTSRIRIDNTVFQLHYSITVIILLSFCIIISTKQYVGDPIDCVRSDSVSQSVGVEVPYPGVDWESDQNEFRYHRYYQWVGFVLFFQSTLFYIPRWLWKMWEGGKIQALMMDLDVGVCSEHEKKQKKKLLVDYLFNSRGHHNWYAGRYFFCELLALANVIFQIYALDRFFDGEFLTYGLQVIEFSQMDQGKLSPLGRDPIDKQRIVLIARPLNCLIDPMIRIFPRVTKCRFYKYGPSANIETIDALCLLPLNIVNEKIYIFLWFWFLLLALLTAALIFYRMIIIACPPVRVYLLSLRFKLGSLDHLHTIVRRMSVGDWFLGK